ncbi:ABC transporter ATP-binding protein [Desulfomonile tiedjei]|uniref:Amino acid/amide ABC transporter ATP-binding protein 2, HAAT family n=1 Tax=Desulfomonile tiedjei (strain ATCC 49306 / DSM 6799 / DCB-1) TaxID=706587 RepID=I4CB20_DESTA|nr:ABC transporter ATP-binding protein [Desulfomonile tiedjei]AFM26761.1 amino acid/amide ABC transporter ATP-binding protein 2, HAAT family [Desulfomonile tiedjei DSM 6799]
MLDIRDLHVHYDGIHALKGVSLHVEEKRIVTLLGANGAGKSTTVRAISGIVPASSGEILFQGMPVNKKPAHLIQRQGLVHVPEGRKVFANLTVRENLMMGAYNNRDKAEVNQVMDMVLTKFPILKERTAQLGGTLSGGEQQKLTVGRAMMSKPRLLIMDEPSLGLAPMVVAEVFRIIEEIRSEGVTVFLIEQNANAALKIADYAYLLETGRIVLEGTGEKLLNNPKIKQAYLGESLETAFQD